MTTRSAKEIVRENIESWGEGKSCYEISIDDMRVLDEEGAVMHILNYNNGDGTFFSKAYFDGHYFVCSSKDEV